MGVLKWLFIIELVILGLAAIMQLVGILVSRQNPDDPIYIFFSAFWREFLWPPQDMAAAFSGRGGKGSSSRPVVEDAMYGRIQKNDEGAIDKAELMVLVEPHSPADEVCGRDGDGLKIRVVGEPGESRSNKALIEMVAGAVGVKPYQVTLTKGHYQTRKTVQIQGLDAEALAAKLELLNEAE